MCVHIKLSRTADSAASRPHIDRAVIWICRRWDELGGRNGQLSLFICPNVREQAAPEKRRVERNLVTRQRTPRKSANWILFLWGQVKKSAGSCAVGNHGKCVSWKTLKPSFLTTPADDHLSPWKSNSASPLNSGWLFLLSQMKQPRTPRSNLPETRKTLSRDRSQANKIFDVPAVQYKRISFHFSLAPLK